MASSAFRKIAGSPVGARFPTQSTFSNPPVIFSGLTDPRVCGITYGAASPSDKNDMSGVIRKNGRRGNITIPAKVRG